MKRRNKPAPIITDRRKATHLGENAEYLNDPSVIYNPTRYARTADLTDRNGEDRFFLQPKTKKYLDEINQLKFPAEIGWIYPEDIANLGEHNYLDLKSKALLKIFPQLNYDIAYDITKQTLTNTIKEKLTNWTKEEEYNKKHKRDYKEVWPNSYNEDKWPIPKYN
jgi:hypothetical protein